MAHDPENDDLERIAPMLSRIPRTDPFVLPEGFQDRFAQEVQARLPRATAAATRHSWLWRTAVALPVLAAMVAGWWMLRPHASQEVPATAAATVPAAEAVVALEDDLLHDLSITELAEQAPAPAAPALTPEELAAYYDLTGTDVTDLIENL
ncbi:MAG: hypothetical protein IT228_04625 [Flavobacteriales bacterium]|nr:hypothetical protein [Flavobacteriales bacterium]MCC6576608.1 hypothetical protein [Flavobacteriales bacterium]